jgi:hypothetical protein
MLIRRCFPLSIVNLRVTKSLGSAIIVTLMKHGGSSRLAGSILGSRHLPWVMACLLVFASEVRAEPQISLDSPIGFFTNVAAQLLRSELNVSLNHIQIYPTNDYTPAVHRLLQLTANLYDAATNHTLSGSVALPAVFRPLFASDGVTIYIRGYEEETGTDLLGPMVHLRDVQNPSDRAQLSPYDMVYGVPVIIGAKKGFPNFNEFSMQTEVLVARKLQFLRQGSIGGPIVRTNQMYVVGISNVFGVEAWNSYTNAFRHNVQIIAMATLRATMTNESGSGLSLIGSPVNGFYRSDFNSFNISPGWPGSPQRLTGSSAAYSFKVPLLTNFMVLSNSTYVQSQQKFVPLTNTFENSSGFHVPLWWLNLRHQVIFALV